MSLFRRVTRYLAVNSPTTLGSIFMMCSWLANRLATWPSIQTRVDALLEAAEKQADNTTKGKSEEEKTQSREYLLQVLFNEPLRQGAEAAVLEAELLSNPDWGFQLEHADFDPVWIWHGAKDDNAPIGMMRYLAEKVPHSRLIVFENDTHYTMFQHVDRALDQLFSLEEKK